MLYRPQWTAVAIAETQLAELITRSRASFGRRWAVL
jgi:hypothetical protein